jgi:hypothetical protein
MEGDLDHKNTSNFDTLTIHIFLVQMGKQQEDLKLAMLRDIYGSGLAARHTIEKQILCR